MTHSLISLIASSMPHACIRCGGKHPMGWRQHNSHASILAFPQNPSWLNHLSGPFRQQSQLHGDSLAALRVYRLGGQKRLSRAICKMQCTDVLYYISWGMGCRLIGGNWSRLIRWWG